MYSYDVIQRNTKSAKLATANSNTSPNPTMPSALQSLKNSYLRIRFPWRTRILAGVDLSNNRFFERPCPNGGKPRRTVEFTNKTLDWVDYAGVVDRMLL